MDIYLLRHGETDWNKTGLLQGHTDIPLNENGRKQVRDTAQKLSASAAKMDLIISSPLQRAHESAEIVARQLDYPIENIIVEPMLIERSFGAGEGRTLAERMKKFPDNDYPGMESQTDLIQRAGSAFRRIVNKYSDAENILLTAHGAILFALLEAVAEAFMKSSIVDAGTAAALTQGSIYKIRYTHNADGDVEFAKYDDEKSMFLNIDVAMIARLVKIYM